MIEIMIFKAAAFALLAFVVHHAVKLHRKRKGDK